MTNSRIAVRPAGWGFRRSGPSGCYDDPGVPTSNAEVTTARHHQQENYTGRIDQNFGAKDFVWVRHSGQELNTTSPGSISALTSLSDLPSQQYGASWVHVFSPMLTMQTQYARTHVEYDTSTRFTVPNVAQAYGVASSLAGSYIGGISLMPDLSVTNYWSGGEVSSPADNLSSIHQDKATSPKLLATTISDLAGPGIRSTTAKPSVKR